MGKSILIAIIAVVIIGGGYAVFHKSPSKTPATTSGSAQSASPSSSASPATNQKTAADTITFDGSQFSPATLTVKAGTVVTIENTSSEDLQMQSNPHPTHTDDTDLNVGIVAAGQSQTFTVTKTGTFGYHDHLNPGIQGKITIE